jgi:hypothetical protein
MIIYHYHPETGAYLGEGQADPSPLEEGKYLVPANATTLAPPECGAEQYPAFIVDHWSVIDVTAPVIPQEMPHTLEVAAEIKLAALAARRYEVETGGITIGGAEIKTDRESQAQLNSAFTCLQAGLIADTPWKAVNGWVTVTLAEIQPIAQAVAAHVRDCFATEKAHADVIAALSTVSEVEAYGITTGWPGA